MQKFIRYFFLATALAAFGGTASANQMVMFVTAGDILNAVTGNGTTGTFGANCLALLSNCGVFGAGVQNGGVQVTSGAFASTFSTAAIGYSSPVPTGSASWVATPFAGGYKGFEAGGSAVSNTQEQFITSAYSVGPLTCTTILTAGCYDANLNGSVLSGIAAMNSSTQIGFILTFANTIAAGTTASINLQLLAAALTGSNAGTQTPGLEGSKSFAGNITLNGTLVALPEPSSIGMAIGGLLALGGAAWRRRNFRTKNQ